MLTINENFGASESLTAALQAYRLASGKAMAQVTVKVGGDLAQALYKETRTITPSEDTLRRLPAELGWTDPSRKHRKVKLRKEGTGLARIRLRQLGIAELITRRIHHRFFSAAGWLPAMHSLFDAKRSGQVRSHFGKLGWIEASVREDGNAHIIIGNRADKIATNMAKHGILARAVSRVYANMAPYIRSHLGVAAEQSFQRMSPSAQRPEPQQFKEAA